MTRHRVETRKYNYDAIYQWIIDYKLANNGNSPVIREIMAGCGITSTAQAAHVLTVLYEEGKIKFVGSRAGRRIEVPGIEVHYRTIP